MKDSKQNRNSIWDYLLILAIIIAIGFIICINLIHYCYKINADIASEAVLARLIWDSGEWMPKSWYSGSELRLWQTPNLAALFYGLTHSMSLAMGISCTIMTICIVLSAYFFVSQMSFDKTQKLMFILLCLVLPNHFVVLELVYLFACYYAIHVVIMFYTLGVYMRLMRGKHVNFFFLLTTNLIAIMMGMLSVREILILYVPLCMAELIRQLYVFYKGTWRDKRNMLIGGWCLFLLIVSYVGTRFPFSISQGVSRNVRKGFIKLIESVFPDVLKCLGFSQVNILETILLYLMLLFAVISIFLCIKQVFENQYPASEIWVYIMLWISPVLSMFAVAFTTIDSSERYYFILFYTLSFGLVFFINEVKNKPHFFQRIIYIIILLAFILQIQKIYLPIIRSDEPPMTDAYKVCGYLKENGYKTAYASFENANTMTVLLDGDIRVAAVDSVEKMNVQKCLSSSDWYVPNVPYDSQTAYIITQSEQATFENFYELHQEDIQFSVQIGKYLIYVSDYNFTNLD